MSSLCSSFEYLFEPRLVDDEWRPVRYIWVGDEDIMICVDPTTTQVFAQMDHDGYGKYEATVYVSIAHAFRISRKAPASVRTLRSFPRIGLEMIRYKCWSMSEAVRELEGEMKDLKII